jgi:hypothetical protein
LRHFAAGNAVGLVAHLREALATQDGGTVQWVILCFWLLELLLAKNADYPDLKGNIQSFLLGHINMLHIRTAFQLVSSHNRDGAASIAGAVKAFENVILHLIDKHSWRTIYDSFNLQVEDLLFETSTSLLDSSMMPCMAAEGDFNLEVSRVFTSFLRSDIQLYTSHSASQPDVLKQMNYTPVRSDSAFAHFVILLCTKIHDVAAACNYLDTCLMRLYDLQSALRAFTSKSLLVFGASLFLKLGLYEDAVDLALEFDITLAKDLANLFEVPQALRKRLWLRVVRHIINDRSLVTAYVAVAAFHHHILRLAISESGRAFKESRFLSIEDMLFVFPDFIVIDTFKTEIEGSLKESDQHIISTRTCMAASANTAKSLCRKTQTLVSLQIRLCAGTRCVLSGCPVLMRPFNYYASGFVNQSSSAQLEAHGCAKGSKCHRRSLPLNLDCPLTGCQMINSIDSAFT